jgi:tetrahydromethanopterin S-methyltransferase subunit B
MLSASEAFIAVVAPLVDLVPVAEEVVDEVVDVVEEVFVPAVPPSTALPGRLTVAFAARAWKFARVRVAFAVGLFVLRQSQVSFGMRVGETYLTLITMVIPLWQCFPCEQYNQIGVVLLIIIVYVGVV